MADGPLICFRGVKKSFGPKVVFDGLDLGKSVLLKLLIGLMTPDEGAIEFDGVDITKLEHDELAHLRNRIGMLFQGSALFDSLSVADNVAYGLREHLPGGRHRAEIAERVAKVLEMVGLPGTEELTPSELSGGMKKRIALARTIALMPEVLLYDEPTTGLDPPNAGRIAELIYEINKKMCVTSIVVTHDMHTAFAVSDRMAMLRDGHVVLHGPPAVFKGSEDRYIHSFIDSAT